MLEWFREFGAAVPDALRALYYFGDPAGGGQGWVGAAIMLLWLGPLMALPLYLAKVTYGKREWFSATMGVMGASTFIWWVHGVLPHAWIQFVEANETVLAGAIIPETAGFDISEDYRLQIASNLYGVIADSVVAVLMIGGIVLTLLLFLKVQKQFPKSLAAGEVKPEAGGYK
ncbi:MAG: hypothetical protein WEB09_09660 [Nitriliruptor sp.]